MQNILSFWRTQHWLIKIFLLIIILAYVGKLMLITAPVKNVIANVTYDDAYYYFQIARNITDGFGSTYDRLSPTNGYHPLWMIVILPFYMLFSGEFAPIYGILGLSFLLDICIAFTLFALVKRITNKPLIQWTALLLWTITPFNYFNVITGLETPLAILLVVLFISKLIDVSRNPSGKEYIHLGILSGLMMLSRTDYVILAGAPFILWIIQRNTIALKKYAWKYILVATLIVSPWLVWNLATFGTIEQTSGASYAAVQHQLVEFANRDVNPLLRSVKAGYGDIAEGLPVMFEQTGSWLAYLILFGVLIGYVVGRRKQNTENNQRLFQVILSLSCVFGIFFFIHVGIRLSLRAWHFLPLMNLLPLLWLVYLGHRSCEVTEHTVNMKRTVVTGAIMFALIVIPNFTYIVWREYKTPIRGESHFAFLAAAEWINTHIPEGVRVGSLNSGIIGYFTHGRTVNLDGLVNNKAHEAIVNKRLYEYASKDLGLKYIVDFDRAISFKFVESWGPRDFKKHFEPITLIYGGKDYDPVGMTAYLLK